MQHCSHRCIVGSDERAPRPLCWQPPRLWMCRSGAHVCVCSGGQALVAIMHNACSPTRAQLTSQHNHILLTLLPAVMVETAAGAKLMPGGDMAQKTAFVVRGPPKQYRLRRKADVPRCVILISSDCGLSQHAPLVVESAAQHVWHAARVAVDVQPGCRAITTSGC